MNSSLANQNCAAKFEMCIPASMMIANFQFHCVGTNIKRRDDEKGPILYSDLVHGMSQRRMKLARYHPKNLGKSNNRRMQYILRSCGNHYCESPGSPLMYTGRMRSFMLLLRHSISGTCFFLTYAFSSICMWASAAWAGSNCWYALSLTILNPLFTQKALV